MKLSVVGSIQWLVPSSMLTSVLLKGDTGLELVVVGSMTVMVSSVVDPSSPSLFCQSTATLTDSMESLASADASCANNVEFGQARYSRNLSGTSWASPISLQEGQRTVEESDEFCTFGRTRT